MMKKISKAHDLVVGTTKHLEPSKRSPFKQKMTGAGRAKKLRVAKHNSLQKIHIALRVEEQISTPELLEIAAARLAGIGVGNPVADFDFATSYYLKRITCQTGNTIPVDSFWNQLLDLVMEADPALASIFARDFKNQFIWCLAGHVHRLRMAHDQLPTSIQAIEFIKKGGKQNIIARRRDGTTFPVPDDGFQRHDPCIIFAGMKARPAFAPHDLQRLEQMDSEDAVAQLDSGKFNFTIPDNELFITDTVLNVAKPADLADVRHGLIILGFKASRKM